MTTKPADSFELALRASRKLAKLAKEEINDLLLRLADAAEASIDEILAENKKDLDQMDASDPKYDRLKLTKPRIESIASDIRNVAALPSPLGRILSQDVLPNGLKIRKVSVPFGVIGIIYEARPNVTFDVFSLCIKSGNAVVLKGGSDAVHSNMAIAKVIRRVLNLAGIDENALILLPPTREAATALLNARGYVDLIIPRGSQALIDYVRENAKIPVIETGAGICHTYFDAAGDPEVGRKVIHNAKTRRVSVCNSLDCLVIHKSRISDLPNLVELMEKDHVEIFADPDAFQVLSGKYPDHLLHHAVAESFGTEFLSYKMAVKSVSSLEEALEHIATFGSKHSEAIISADRNALDEFLLSVDAAAVYSNASTAFTDGAQFGLGAEIGISTQKLHARGPMALQEITTYKWIVEGEGQIRE
ncbi:MAG TPA: glutamate-5-semialdehyde dehydrogenase [Prolixibacteraceae bacterium]|nr:glutamate-5-semialdehyde dehydrogenase [Prolixibacteraceae bacterium]